MPRPWEVILVRRRDMGEDNRSSRQVASPIYYWNRLLTRGKWLYRLNSTSVLYTTPRFKSNQRETLKSLGAECTFNKNSENQKAWTLWELNPRPFTCEAKIIPLDQAPETQISPNDMYIVIW